MAEFNCTSAEAFALVWRVNGSRLNEPVLQHQGITQKSFFPEVGVKGSTLNIPTTRAISNTTVTCVAVVLDGMGITTQYETNAALMVQSE